MNTRLLALLLGGSLAWLAAEPTVWARGFGGYGSYATTPGAPPAAYGNFGGSLQASRFAYTSPARANPRLGSFLGVPDESAVDPAGLRLELLDRYDRPGSDPARGMGGFLEGYGRPYSAHDGPTDVQTEDGVLPVDDSAAGPALGAGPALPSDGGLHLLGNAGTGGQRDVKSLADVEVSDHAAQIRRNWRPDDLYSAEWYRDFPAAWRPAAGTDVDVWMPAAWETLAAWLGAPLGQPWNFNYGTIVVYRDNDVYVNQTQVAAGAEYYQQARTLATTDVDAAGEPWLPLGVFSLAHQDQTKPTMIVQLAINKAGVVRGNYTNVAAGETLPLHGSLDRKTQRVAWTIGANSSNVVEAGLYNLTQDQAPALLHYGPDRTEQWLLVRLPHHAASGTPAPRGS